MFRRKCSIFSLIWHHHFVFHYRIEPTAEEKRSETLDDEQYEIDSQSSGNVYDLDMER